MRTRGTQRSSRSRKKADAYIAATLNKELPVEPGTGKKNAEIKPSNLKYRHIGGRKYHVRKPIGKVFQSWQQSCEMNNLAILIVFLPGHRKQQRIACSRVEMERMMEFAIKSKEVISSTIEITEDDPKRWKKDADTWDKRQEREEEELRQL